MSLQPTLENDRVKLIPLTLDNYHQIAEIASEPGLVKYSPGFIESSEGLKEYIMQALKDRDQERAIPFIIYDKKYDAYAGSTRYMQIDRKNKVLHIGATWIGSAFHGTGLNTAIKSLMLPHAFVEMDFEKVEFRIDERNTASRKAVEKFGASLEGILRKNVYLADGFKRNTCCYGLLREEWNPITT
ncbi:MAG: GNAT family N-acetyltransferase [Eudoraea sp.]|nr:GNAT family N-acetyltransferase [Eudoraea sp.]NNK31418.1 GNAT family N-acetyltransferase [Flavobacteriaceae bacterium]